MKPLLQDHPGRWMHLVYLAQEIEHRLQREELTAEELRVYFESIQETFGRDCDPLEEFPSYALTELCRQVGRALATLPAGRRIG